MAGPPNYDKDVKDVLDSFGVIYAEPSDPKTFTWENARDLAVIVRDGLLMIVKGFERYFDIGKK